jgi:nicotinamide phosphoribosyltransferase
MTTTLPILNCDGYKIDHRRQYPENLELVFSNLTARGTRIDGLTKTVFVGLQYFLKRYLIEDWNTNFFSRPVDEVATTYTKKVAGYIGPNEVGEQHVRDLHALGYLPLEFWALPEGSNVDLRVPMLVVHSTDKRFGWLTNSIETLLSCCLWLPCTTATTALMYRKLLDGYAKQTNPEMTDFVKWQGHDFSFRGHGSPESASISGAGHLLYFTGTDTHPALDHLEYYYNADRETELIGGTIPATEHSVMCMGGKEDELETFRRIITKVYPKGPVSIVSDTWDFWDVVNPIDGICVKLKDEIMAREGGPVVIRPDSGDPVKIVTGYFPGEYTETPDGRFMTEIDGKQVELTDCEVSGMIQCLWDIFGGTVTSKGFAQLDPHIGAIYGDSITLERAEQICERLVRKGFASTNLVYGIGSFTYQGAITPNAIVTRDTHMMAVKATYGEVTGENGETVGLEIFKDPQTDSGMKKSAKGLTAVYQNEKGDFWMKDQATWEEVRNCAFRCVFRNSKMVKETFLKEMREIAEKAL